MPCVAVKADGHPCTNPAPEGEFRCRIHIASRRRKGPNATEVAEMKATYKKDLWELEHRYKQDVARAREEFHGNPEEMGRQLDLLCETFVDTRRQMRREGRQAVNAILNHQADLIRQTGVDPDADAHARRARGRAQRDAALRDAREIRAQLGADGANLPDGVNEDWRPRVRAALERGENLIEQLRVQREGGGAAAVAGAALGADRERMRLARVAAALGPVPPLLPVVQVGELREFAEDRQNVHQPRAVRQTKEIVERILKIPVPPEYRWNMNECSRTPGEIILECKVTPTATWQMLAKYCQADNVFEMGNGIYGRTLDCVWQYIKRSEHKEELYKILKTEMQDNIGMCAQGNLSRLANIVAGYMEGVGQQESVAEILGRLLPPLMNIEDEVERLDRAKKIMDDYRVPVADRPQWLEALA